MIEKIIKTAARVLTVWMAAEAVRQVWNELNKEEEGKKENK